MENKAYRDNPLVALSSAALSLPAFAATQPVQTEVSIKSTMYEEENIPSHKILIGSDERYDIVVNQFRLLSPLADAWSVGVNISKERMSGASPWGTITGLNGEASLIMSGATIHDSRTEISVNATHYGENRSLSVGLARSEEDDYKATAITLGGEWDFNNKLSTLSLGVSYSDDEIEPTDALIFGRVQEEEKDSRSMSIGWAQVLDKSSVLHAGLSITDHDGYLSDPYKLRDVRPDDRLEWAVSLRYRRYFDNQNAALHLDYRYYDDDWGIDSHTLYAAWYQNLGVKFQLVPSVRYYSQDEADFYLSTDNFTLPVTQAQSSDYRLSTYGAYTFGLKAIYNEVNWSVSLAVDRYISSESYGLSSGEEHPALLTFNMASISFDFRF